MVTMTTKRKVKWNSLACPKCGTKGAMLEIVFGLPDFSFNERKYWSGGCVINFMDDPEVHCRECGWEGLKDYVRDYWAAERD